MKFGLSQVRARLKMPSLGRNTRLVEDDITEMLSVWKTLIVNARLNLDEEEEAKLNECKSWLLSKRRQQDPRQCPDCGKRKYAKALRCAACRMSIKAPAPNLETPIKTETKKETMLYTEILIPLKEKRTALVNDLAILRKELDKIEGAIAALEGSSYVPNTNVAEVKKSASEMFELLAREFVKREKTTSTPKVIFSNDNLRDLCKELYPTEILRFKQGIGNAINTLKKRSVIRIAPGGHEFVNP